MHVRVVFFMCDGRQLLDGVNVCSCAQLTDR